MEKDSSKASAPRRSALARSSQLANAAALPRSTSRSGSNKEPRALDACIKPAKDELKSAGAKPALRTRQRQPDESRAQMLERLSNPLISLHEAGVLLQVCAATVRRLSNEGELPHQRTEGGQRRFRLRDVLRLMDERERRRSSSSSSRTPSSRAPARIAARSASSSAGSALSSARGPIAPRLAEPGPRTSSERASDRAEEMRAEAARTLENRERLAAMRSRVEATRSGEDAGRVPPRVQAPASRPPFGPGQLAAPGENLRPNIPPRVPPQPGAARVLPPQFRASAAASSSADLEAPQEDAATNPEEVEKQPGNRGRAS